VRTTYGELFDSVVRTRNTDPDTSREAAERVAPKVSDHERIIVGVLNRIGPATSREIASACKELTYEQIHKRLAGLRGKGIVNSDNRKVCTIDGVERIEWRLK